MDKSTRNLERNVAQDAERFRRIFDHSDDGFCVIEMVYDADGRPKDVRYLEVNAAFATQSGLQDVVGRTLGEIASTIEPVWLDFYEQVVRTRKPGHLIYAWQLKDRVYDVFATPIDSPEFFRAAVRFRNVTSAKRNEETLAFQAGLLSHVHDAILALDESEHIIYWNPPAEKIFGRTAADVIGKHASEIFAPIQPDPPTDQFMKRILSDGELEQEARFCMADGIRYFDIFAKALDDRRGVPTKVLVTMREVTHQRLVDNFLRARERMDSFLLTFNDRIHNLRDPLQIKRIAAEAAGEQMNVEFSSYIELDDTRGTLEPEAIWRSPGIADQPFPGRLDLYGPVCHQQLTEGHTVVIDDFASDSRTVRVNPDENPDPAIAGAAIIAPIQRQNRILALFIVTQQQPRHWLPEEIGLVEEIVQRTLNAVERARSEVELAAWANTLSRLHRLSMMVLNQSDLDHIYQEITKASIELTHADRCNIQLLDEQTGTLQIIAQNQQHGRPFDTAQYAPDGWGASREAARQRRRLIVEDITHSPLYLDKPEMTILLSSGIRATQATPLVSSAGHLVGILATQYNEPHAYEPRELLILDLFARLTADTIERIRSEEQLRTQFRQVDGINRIYRQITHHMTREAFAQVTLDTFIDLTQSDSGLIALAGPDGRMDDIMIRQPNAKKFPECETSDSDNRHWHQYTLSAIPSPLSTVISEARPIIVNDPRHDPVFKCFPAGHMQIRSFMGVPLLEYGQVVGMIATANRAGGYSQTDLAMLEAMGEAFIQLLRRWQAEDALKQSEAKARELVEELRQADNSKNEFLAILSHEIRNPLASITMSLALLDRVTPGSPQAMRARDIIERQTRQLSHLIDDLLDITRIARDKVELKKQRINLTELIRHSAEDYQGQYLGKGVTFRTEIIAQPLFLDADPTRIVQIIGNLLHNAAKFTIKGDEVSLTLQADNDTCEAVIIIADTGEGIAPELLSNLFLPFTQADNSLDRTSGGLGLGLSIAKGFVALHGGTITAFSEGPGQGTRFTIRLPLADNPAADAPGTSRAGEKRARTLRILVIEDSQDLAETFCTLLSILGHEVETAYSGLAGLEKARQMRPDVVLCDIGLPEMDGYAVAQAMRTDPVLKSIFIIAISGYAQADDIERALAAGFNRHLAKPVEMEQLRQILENDIPK